MLSATYRRIREPVRITGGGGPDPLARQVGAAKAKDITRESVRQTLVLPEKELPLAPEPFEFESSCTTALRSSSAEGKARSTITTRADENRASELDLDLDLEGKTGDRLEERQRQPWVVLVAEDQLFSVEFKREELQRRRFALLESCFKVGSPAGPRRGVYLLTGAFSGEVWEFVRLCASLLGCPKSRMVT